MNAQPTYPKVLIVRRMKCSLSLSPFVIFPCSYPQNTDSLRSDCPDNESRWYETFRARWDRPRGPSSLLYNG